MADAIDDPAPSPDTVRGYLETLSNGGRWGEDDQLGTLNFITPEKVARSARLIVEGVRVGCSRRILTTATAENRRPLQRFMARSHDAAPPQGKSTSAEWIGMLFHGLAVTHLDALAHYGWNRRMYNGYPAELVSTERGAEALSVEAMGAGIATRGVLLDLPRVLGVPYLEPPFDVTPGLLDRAASALGISIEAGDIVMIRTGRDTAEAAESGRRVIGGVGWRPDCLSWLRAHDVAVLVGDVPHDTRPDRYGIESPIHVIALVAMGLPLLDNAYLEDLAAHCAKTDRWEFFLTIAPLLLEGGTGSPVNPIAIF